MGENETKFFTVKGEVLKRIFNPAQETKNGTKFKLCYLVLKWISGGNGEFIDTIPIKTFKPDQIHELREGYIVKARIIYSCKYDPEKEIEIRSYSKGDVSIQSPSIYPEFRLVKQDAIEIINDSVNKEEHTETNTLFENEFIHENPEEDDDLPF